MILLIQNSELYNNDLRAMLMAFYPGVRIVTPESDKGKDEALSFSLKVEYGDDKTRAALEGEVTQSKFISGDYRDKSFFRNKLKSAVYELLCNYTGKTLPWGDLTGVRPTKIAMTMLKSGGTPESAVSNYIKTYHVSSSKARLAAKVADFELKTIQQIDMDRDYCLYIGIPFCPSRCLYCSFTSYPIGIYKNKAGEYIDRLCAELDYIAAAYKEKNLVSIYIGGGTPTSIDHCLLDKLLTHIDITFGLGDGKCNPLEYTVEAGRPDSITREKLQVMKRHGITRISINPQTMLDETLKTIGRAHTADDTRNAFSMAREMGFDNINMDIIAGLPGEDVDSMRYTLEEIKKLAPDSLTVHSLAIKRAANLRQQLDTYEGQINRDMDSMLDMVEGTAGELSMEPYYLYRQKNIGGNLENVGYAGKGHECLYNILIMEEITDIIAAGAGASTKLTFHEENRLERVENCKSVDDYIDRFDEMLLRKKKAFSGKFS